MDGRRWPIRWPSRFLRDDRGNAAVIFALVLLPLLGGAGLAIDSMLAFTVEERLQKSLDAAGLAAGQTSVTANIVPDARAFFRSNFDAGPDLATAADPVVQVSPDGTEITLTASATMPTYFMHLFGQNSVTVNARSVISRQTRGLELALILDVTGSMLEDQKISGLRNAANELLNILYGSRETVENLWVGLVPYTGMVNIGIAHKSFLDPADRVNTAPTDFAPDSWSGCVLARTEPRDVSEDRPSVARFSSYLNPDRSTSLFPARHANDWGSGRSPQTQKYRQWSSSYKAYYYEGYGPNFLCPDPVIPLVAAKSRLSTAINNLETYYVDEGATHVNIGLAWGWRILSPGWRGLWSGSPAQLPLAYGTANMDKVIVVLTDGQNTFNYESKGGRVVGPYTAYEAGESLIGISRDDDGLLDGNPTSMKNTAQNELDARTRNVCKLIRDKGIFIYSITFGSLPSGAKGLMQNCASQPTSKYYFHSPDNASLRAAFKSIGSQLNNLRIKR